MGRRALDWEDMFSGSGKNAFDAEFDAERGLEPPSPAILPPSPQDWDEAERAIRKRVEEFSDEALGVAEEWDGEFAHRSELWGPESARQQMRDRAAQHLFDAAHKSISGASRADFQRARERVAEERRVTGERRVGDCERRGVDERPDDREIVRRGATQRRPARKPRRLEPIAADRRI